MTATNIDVGTNATIVTEADYGSQTVIGWDNPANATGVIKTAAIFYGSTNGLGVKVGCFYTGSVHPKYLYRAGATIGTVTKGSWQTFTGLSFAVTANDLCGYYSISGDLRCDHGGSCAHGEYLSGDHMKVEAEQTYTPEAVNWRCNIYLTGVTPSLIQSVPCIARIMLMST